MHNPVRRLPSWLCSAPSSPRRGRLGTRGAVRGDGTSHPRAGEIGALRRDGLHDAAAEVSCHPEALPGARTVISAALCYYALAAEPGPGEGRSSATPGPTVTPTSARSWTRSAAASAAPIACSSTRTTTSTAKEPRALIAFYGKNTLAITRRHGSWVVLGTLVSDVLIEASERLDAARVLHALHRCCVPHRRTRRAGRAHLDALPLVLDGARADPGAVPHRSSARACTAATSARRVPVESRSRSVVPASRPSPALSRASLCASGSRRTGTSSSSATTASTSRATTPRWLRETRSSPPATSGARPSGTRSYAMRRG